ncbi:MAG: RCC1 domain-containing protein, partial [Acidimicrobiaceae bacterium]|nr:RCC1 domain-containing protein [Acidimicrobiaceae bacterium]
MKKLLYRIVASAIVFVGIISSCNSDNSDNTNQAGSSKIGIPILVSAGDQHSCALGTNDTITCWGNNDNGQTDTPTGTYKNISAGSNHTCALGTNDTITCWGNNDNGQT